LNNRDGVLKGLWQMVPFNDLHPEGQVLLGRLYNTSFAPAVTQGCILLNMTLGIVPSLDQDHGCAFPLLDIKQSSWKLVCIVF
jgi:hypothetical protein